MTHGSNSSYRNGCRCDACRRAHADASNRYYHANLEKALAAQALQRSRRIRPCVRCSVPAEWKSQYCGACKLVRRAELRQVAKLKERERRRDPAIREQQRRAAAVYRSSNPERVRESGRRSRSARQPHLRRLYGISQDQVAALTAAQEGRCAICRVPCDLTVDHDHSTGRVRGLLCGNCNRGLGMFGDSVERLAAAIGYLSPFVNDVRPQLALFDEGIS